MTKPVIGLTMYGLNEQKHYTIPSEYIDCIVAAGGVPLVLPLQGDIPNQLGLVDGILLIGGGDICPSCYAQTSHETVYMLDEQRDQYELELARQVLASGKPVFGICRGIQIVNVALGGTLIQHLPDVKGDLVKHRMPPREPIDHPVIVKDGSRLAGIVEELKFLAPSWHHQALDQVADQLNVVAHAPDGTVEAVEMPGHRWCICVQWHPELAGLDNVIQQRLFRDFVAHC